MDINYLVNEVLPQRKKEIEEGKNASTRQPVYVVLDLDMQVCSGHNDFSITSNLKEKEQEFGYIDNSLDCECREFKESPRSMRQPQEVTRFWTDRFIAFFFTSKAAHEYLEYQSHNLSSEAYVYVAYSGYRNLEMDNLLKNEISDDNYHYWQDKEVADFAEFYRMFYGSKDVGTNPDTALILFKKNNIKNNGQ
jgi:hypothetical protein